LVALVALATLSFGVLLTAKSLNLEATHSN
jgi:hypothetical protein